MKRQKIRNDIRNKVMTVAAGGARNTRVDLVLATYNMAADETALKQVCRSASADHKYW